MNRHMKHYRPALVALVLALTLGAGVATAAATSGGRMLPQDTTMTQHAHAGNTATNAANATTEDRGPAAGAHPANHGMFVSQAAHSCGQGAHAVHGTCVRAVAQSAKGKPSGSLH